MMPYVLDGLLLVFLFWFALTGLRTGFFGMLGRLVASLAALAAAYLLIGPVSAFLGEQPAFQHLQAGLAASILRLFGSSTQSAAQAVTATGLPPSLQSGLLSRLAGAAGSTSGMPTPPTGAAESPFALLSVELAAWVLSAIVFLLLFSLLLGLIRFVLHQFSQAVNRLPVIGALNRLAGLFAGIAYALLVVSVVLLLVTLAAPWVPGVAHAIGDTALLSRLYEQNPLLMIF